MKYLFSPALAILLVIVASSPAAARSSVKIENTINGETNNLEVESNDGDSSRIEVNQHNENTNVSIEENGQVRTFEATGDEEINWKSEDGSARVLINQSGSSETVSDDKEATQESTPEERTEGSNDNDSKKQSEDNNDTASENSSFSLTTLFEALQNFFTSFFT